MSYEKHRPAARELWRPADKSAASRVFLGPSARAMPAAAIFEYLGARAMTVIGRWTGYQYRFSGYGARVAVDPRDRLSLSIVHGLREVHEVRE